MRPMELEDEEWDAHLRAAIQNSPFPPTPQLGLVVQRWLRRRRFVGRAGALGVMLVAAFLVVVWQWPIRSNDDGLVAVQASSGTQTLEMAHLQILFSSPPVDVLDQFAQQQAAFVSAIDQVVKE